MFKIEVIGNLGADAEVREANGAKFVSFRVASTSHYRTESGEDRSITDWIDCTMNNVESKVVQFLKAGTKVFVRGNASLRVYSSKKDRMMKAGVRCSVIEVELCGGVSDDVPRQIVDPLDGTIHDTKKYYWCDASCKGMKVNDVRELTDVRGGRYLMNGKGFVAPVMETPDSDSEDTQANDDASENQA